MDSENIITENGTEAFTAAMKRAAAVSALSIIGNASDSSVRVIVDRDLNVPLASFTLAYRFSGVGKGGSVTESRFFSLVYDREGLNSKDTISIRFKVPDGYNAVGCTAYISRIVYTDGRDDEYSFDGGDAGAVSCTAEGVDLDKLARGGKMPKTAKTVLISAAAAAAAALMIWGAAELASYNGIKNVVNGLISDGSYGEAYMVAAECGSSTVKRVTCSNIVTKSLNDRDYRTAYVFSTITGREKNVFKRVEYEIINSPDALTGDALSVLKKLGSDDEFDRTIKEYIKRAEENGDYPGAIAAAEELRAPAERALLRRNLIVDGVCSYSTDGTLGGTDKYDKAFDYFRYYATGNESTDRSMAEEIISRCLERGDEAGAFVLSGKFGEFFGSFGVTPDKLVISSGNNSIANSLDSVYKLLSDEQKRAYHAEPLAISEEVKNIVGGSISGTDIKDAVSVATYENRTAVLHKNGSVTHIANGSHNTTSTVPAGVNAVQIAVGLSHTVILNSDGTVVAVGDNTYGQCAVKDWTDIVEIAAGRNFTLGLKSDGTVIACGSDKCGQCRSADLSNVISLEACDQSAVYLFSDGTVLVRGDRSFGLDRANSFTDVEQIKAGGSTVIVKKTDGTFDKADGCINASSGDVSGWSSDTVTYAVGSQCIACIDRNGRLRITGDGAPN